MLPRVLNWLTRLTLATYAASALVGTGWHQLTGCQHGDQACQRPGSHHSHHGHSHNHVAEAADDAETAGPHAADAHNAAWSLDDQACPICRFQALPKVSVPPTTWELSERVSLPIAIRYATPLLDEAVGFYRARAPPAQS